MASGMGWWKTRQRLMCRGVKSLKGSTFSSGISVAANSTFSKRLTVSSGMSIAAKSTFAKGLTCSSALAVSAGGATITKGGVTASSGGYKDAVALSTSTGTLANWGVSVLDGSTAKNWALTAPSVGVYKEICCRCTENQTVTAASGSYFMSSGGSTTLTRLTFNAQNEVVALRGYTTAIWYVVSNTNTVALSTV